MTDSATCSAPGCSEPGTNKCSSCKITLYCCVACQTVDWPSHKEVCQGHLRKVAIGHLRKAEVFWKEQDFIQSLGQCELALTKLDKLKARPLDVIKIIDEALRIKFNALNFMGQHKEVLKCAKKRYSMWAAGYMRNPGMLDAAFPLIEGLLHNNEYEQALLIAHTAYEMIINDTDGIIPADQQQQILADGSKFLALATYWSAMSGGIPPEEKQKAGKEAIALARKTLEINTQLHGATDDRVAYDTSTVAKIMDYFNGDHDDEVVRLFEVANAIYIRLHGRTSLPVANGEKNLANTFSGRASRARDANDPDQRVANLKLALSHYREAVRIYTAINRMDRVEGAAQCVVDIEGQLIRAASAATAASRG